MEKVFPMNFIKKEEEGRISYGTIHHECKYDPDVAAFICFCISAWVCFPLSAFMVIISIGPTPPWAKGIPAKDDLLLWELHGGIVMGNINYSKSK